MLAVRLRPLGSGERLVEEAGSSLARAATILVDGHGRL
jgi:hypothetical protein